MEIINNWLVRTVTLSPYYSFLMNYTVFSRYSLYSLVPSVTFLMLSAAFLPLSSPGRHQIDAGKSHRNAGRYHRSAGRYHRSVGRSHRNAGKSYRNAGKSHRSAGRNHRNAGKDQLDGGRIERIDEKQRFYIKDENFGIFLKLTRIGWNLENAGKMRAIVRYLRHRKYCIIRLDYKHIIPSGWKYFIDSVSVKLTKNDAGGVQYI